MISDFHYESSEVPDSSVVSFDEARALARSHGTPLLVCDLNRLRDNYGRLKSLVPGAEIYYAIKANPLPEIVKALVRLGSKFDVASKNEMKLCLDCGAKPRDLLYANPVKPPESIRYAQENGITTFTYDSLSEIGKMAENAPGCDAILRLAVPDVGSVCKFSTKFGAQGKYAMRLLSEARDRGLSTTGLSFHVGSQCTRIENYSRALDFSLRVFEKARARGFPLEVLDLGGGIPIEYITGTYSFEDLSQLLNRHIEAFPKDVKVILEPGRPMVGDIMTLLTRVIGMNRRRNRDCVYLDDGVYNSLSEKVFGHCEYRIVSDNKGPLTEYIVFGPTCDSMDVISKRSCLPEQETGDLLLVLNVGAYTNAAATHFNGFDPAKIIFI